MGFQIVHDDAAPLRWPAGQDLERRIATLFGEGWRKELVPVEAQAEGLRLRGFVGQPGVSRGTRQEQFLFVNHRPVESRTLHFALQEGYHNSLMRGRYPVTVLFLDLDPAGVDVNIHPAKREVRFHDDAQIRFFVKRAVQEALQGYAAAPVSVPLSVREEPPAYAALTEVPPARQETFLSPEIARTPERPAPAFVPEARPAEPVPEHVSAPAPSALRSAAPLLPPEEAAANPLGLRILGIVARLYIVAESPEGLVLIDQHAAHERVLFEQMLERMRAGEVPSQRLLLPATVELPPREAEFLSRQLEPLAAVGVSLSAFGGNGAGGQAFLVDALPPMVAQKNVPELIRDLVADLQQEGGQTRKDRHLSEEVVAKTVCRRAVKANDRLSLPEAERLVTDLLACALPYTCPHGRPTMIQITKGELEKKFGRVV